MAACTWTVYSCWAYLQWESTELVSLHKTKHDAWRAGRDFLLGEYRLWEAARMVFGHNGSIDKPEEYRVFVKEHHVA